MSRTANEMRFKRKQTHPYVTKCIINFSKLQNRLYVEIQFEKWLLCITAAQRRQGEKDERKNEHTPDANGFFAGKTEKKSDINNKSDGTDGNKDNKNAKSVETKQIHVQYKCSQLKKRPLWNKKLDKLQQNKEQTSSQTCYLSHWVCVCVFPFASIQ